MTDTPLTTEEMLLNAIRDNLDADDPRLIYADWLDEQPVERVPCPACDSGRKVNVVECAFCEDGTVRDERRQRRAEFIKLSIELGR